MPWKAFEQSLRVFLTASGLDDADDERKIAILLNVIGEDGLRLYNNFTLNKDEKKVFENVVEKFRDHCEPKKNILHSRFLFYSRKQEDDESFDGFLTDVRKLVKDCKFKSEDEAVRDRLVLGTNDLDTQKKLVIAGDAELEEVIKTLRLAEIGRQQAAEVQGNVNKVDKVRSKPTQNVVMKCKWCGQQHERKRELCPARGKLCTKCNKFNHFATVCHSRFVQAIANNQSGQEDLSDNEFYCGSVQKKVASKQSVKENETRRKPKARPYSAGVIDSKKRESAKVARFVTNSPKRAVNCKHETLIEELKDTNERVKSLELTNVQLTDDNKVLRKQLEKVNEEKHVAELKLVECEKFIGRLGKEYENRNAELKAVRQNESKIMAELQKERNERKNLAIQRDKDSTITQDLQRQVKEMEMILRRKHPDSVSALIVASKSSTVEDNKKKLLEERIARLEQELKDKESHFQGILLTLQEKFGDMKQKYENHIIDVERQLMEDRKVNTELKNKLNKLNLVDTATQTVPKPKHSSSTQTVVKPDRASSAVNRMTQNSALLINRLKEDSYLVATIKGLQAELTAKQRTIAKINRETEELRKNLRSLQKEKEVLLHLNPQKKPGYRPSAKSAENILVKVTSEMESELSESKKHQEVLMQERSSLLDSLKRTNEEFILLKKKRIQDLHTLQLAHEKELMQMNMQVYPLQEEIKLLSRTVEILQEKVRAADDKLIKYQAAAKDFDVHAGGDNPTSFRNRKDTGR